MDDVTHCLRQDIALTVGVNAALVFERIRYFCQYHETNGTHYYEGQYWCFNSYKAWIEQLPFLSERQIRTSIEKLEENGLITSGNFNKKRYDKTKWYTVVNVHKHKNDTPLSEMSEAPLTLKSDASDTEVRPIPKQTTNKPKTNGVFEDLWKEITPTLPRARRKNKSKASSQFIRLAKEFGEDRLVAAVRAYYADEPQRKNNCEYAAAFTSMFNDRKFEGYLDGPQEIAGGKTVWERFQEKKEAAA